MKVWNWTVARLTFCRFCMEGGDGSNKSPMHSWDLAVKWIKGTTYLLKAQGWKADAPICRTEGSKKSNTLGNLGHAWALRTWIICGPWDHHNTSSSRSSITRTKIDKITKCNKFKRFFDWGFPLWATQLIGRLAAVAIAENMWSVLSTFLWGGQSTCLG